MKEIVHGDNSKELLQKLLFWYGEGLKRPLHFFPGMALKFAKETVKKDPGAVIETLREEWDNPSPYAGYVESRDEYYSRAFSSGEEALNDEFLEITRAIAVEIRKGLSETDFGKKKK